MKCRGNFIFKSIEHSEAGSFTNDKGQVVNYNASYKLNLDEWVDGNLNSLTLKIPDNSIYIELVNNLRLLKPYQSIEIEFDLFFYNSLPKVIPVAFKKVDSNNK